MKAHIYKHITLFCLLIFSVNIFAKTIQLTSLQTLSIDQNTRLIFTFNDSANYHCFTLTNPDRLVVDLTNVKFSKSASSINIKNTDIKSIRTGYHQNTLRIVFELNQPLIPKPYTQKFWNKSTHRLMIDLIPKNKKATPEKVAVISSQESQAKEKIVVIDPGHGGKDPGATGVRGTHEKDVVLAIAKDIYTDLKKEPNIRPVLTRGGDYFVPLRGRLQLARKGEADLFIAIHADAYKTRDARGVSVYALSERGATSEAARWLAQKENNSELMGGVDLSDKSYLLRSVLLDLSQAATIRDSLILGKDILDALHPVARLHRYRVEQAPFVVLKSPDIPSLLIETGFISNRQEELQLRDKSYQQKLAAAITQGITNYFWGQAPS